MQEQRKKVERSEFYFSGGFMSEGKFEDNGGHIDCHLVFHPKGS